MKTNDKWQLMVHFINQNIIALLVWGILTFFTYKDGWSDSIIFGIASLYSCLKPHFSQDGKKILVPAVWMFLGCHLGYSFCSRFSLRSQKEIILSVSSTSKDAKTILFQSNHPEIQKECDCLTQSIQALSKAQQIDVFWPFSQLKQKLV